MISLSKKQSDLAQKTSRFIPFVSFIIFFLPLSFVFAQDKISPKGVAVFGIQAKNMADNTLTAESVDSIKKIFIDCGRFMPAGNELEIAYNEAKKNSGENEKDIYLKTAELLKVDLYVKVSAYQIADMIYADMDLVPLNQEYQNIKKRIKVKSRLKLNIPLKIGREIAVLHKKIPVSTNIIKAYGNDLYLIDSGEWQGIKNNEIYKLPEYNVRVIRAGRFESVVKIPASKNEGERLVIIIFPDTGKIIKELDDSISRNTINRYGLDVQSDPEKRLLEGICIVNMGSNLCIPGYGAFLSTGYLGFKDSNPDWAGVTVSTSLIAAHLLLTEFLTDFKTSFFPWKQDGDKTNRMRDLHVFLWAALPVTFSVAYMDQLAFQFGSSEHVPPFFYDKDNIAAVFSLFLPGGGLFYKGHRLTGWGFYFSEMSAAGYGIYNSDKNSGKYALYALGTIKLLDIIYSYLARPSYSFYNLENEGATETTFLNMSLRKSPDGNNTFNIMMTLNMGMN